MMNTQPSFTANIQNQPFQGVNQNSLFGTPKAVTNQPPNNLFGQTLNVNTPNLNNQGFNNQNANTTGGFLGMATTPNTNPLGFNTTNNQIGFGNNLQANNMIPNQQIINNQNVAAQNLTGQVNANTSMASLFQMINPKSGKLTNYQIEYTKNYINEL